MILDDLQGATARHKAQGSTRKVQGARRMAYGAQGNDFIFSLSRLTTCGKIPRKNLTNSMAVY
jgi:hypothetical protein